MIAKSLLLLAFTVAASAVSAQEMKKQFIDSVPAEASSAAVKVQGGRFVYLAGFTASENRFEGGGGFDSQFKAAFDKIRATLEKAGGSLDDIVSLSVMLTDLRYVPEFAKLAKDMFHKGYPAISYVEVSHLASPPLLMEIQPVAVIP